MGWDDVKRRCSQLGVSYVPELSANTITEYMNQENILQTASCLSDWENPSVLDSNHIREGVCVRIEHEGKTTILKNKSFEFYVLEGVLKDEGVADMEEAN